jgi:hypothetical protein
MQEPAVAVHKEIGFSDEEIGDLDRNCGITVTVH